MLLHPAAHLPAADERQARDAREEEDEESSCDARGRDQGEPDLDATRARPGCGDRRHRRQRGAIEQADDDQSEAIAPRPAVFFGPRRTTAIRIASSEASRQRASLRPSGTACGGERQRFGAFILGERALPAPGLEGVGEQEEDPGSSRGPDPAFARRPAGMDEMHDREEQPRQEPQS